VIDTVETHRETLTGLLDVYLSSTSNKMNSVMKVLTMITTIFMPLSFLAGLYGMNFTYLPGATSIWGFPAVLLIMVLIILGMSRYFRRKGWL
jgi:magnesium transporter